MPNEKALSEEKLAELEARARITPYAAYEALPSLLAEVRLGREALDALESFVGAGLATGKLNEARDAAKSILRKAGRR
jgi:hypothetical protein